MKKLSLYILMVFMFCNMVQALPKCEGPTTTWTNWQGTILNKIIGSSKRQGMTIMPLLLYFNHRGLAKLSIGLGKGKKKYDKREDIKSKEWDIKRQRLEKNKEI